MFFLISNELQADIEIESTKYVRPAPAETEPEEPVSTRKRAEKAIPLQPPPDDTGIELNTIARVELNAERATFGSIADIIGPNDVRLELHAPVSDLVPLYVVQPFYPLSAAMKEIEGYVVVKFSVRENGTVSNPMVVSSEPRIVFDQAALKAVSRFKFKPRMVGGDRVRVEDVQMRFAFNLESLYDIDEEYRK